MNAAALRIAQERCRSFFYQLLVAPLQGAIARTHHDDVTVLIGQNLCLNVAGAIQKLLQKAFPTTKGGCSLTYRRFIQLGHFLHLPRHLQATASATKGRFNGHRETVCLGKADDFLGALHRLCRAGHQRRTNLQCNLACRYLVAQGFNRFGTGANPYQTGIYHCPCELGALRQKTVARVHGICPALLGNSQQLGNVQIRLGRAHTMQRPCFIGSAYMQRIRIRVGIHGYRSHAVVFAGTGNANGNFATVGNQNFANHRLPFAPPVSGSALNINAGQKTAPLC